MARKPPGSKSSDLVDEQLEKYRSMRDFGITAEPSGQKPLKKSKAAKPPKDEKRPSKGLVTGHDFSHADFDQTEQAGFSPCYASFA